MGFAFAPFWSSQQAWVRGIPNKFKELCEICFAGGLQAGHAHEDILKELLEACKVTLPPFMNYSCDFSPMDPDPYTSLRKVLRKAWEKNFCVNYRSKVISLETQYKFSASCSRDPWQFNAHENMCATVRGRIITQLLEYKLLPDNPTYFSQDPYGAMQDQYGIKLLLEEILSHISETLGSLCNLYEKDIKPTRLHLNKEWIKHEKEDLEKRMEDIFIYNICPNINKIWDHIVKNTLPWLKNEPSQTQVLKNFVLTAAYRLKAIISIELLNALPHTLPQRARKRRSSRQKLRIAICFLN